MSLSSVLAVNTLWGFKVPEPQQALLSAEAVMLAPAPLAAEATPEEGGRDPTDLEKLSTDFAALTLRVQQAEEAASVAPTQEVCETLHLQAMSERVSNRLDDVENRVWQQLLQQQRPTKR